MAIIRLFVERRIIKTHTIATLSVCAAVSRARVAEIKGVFRGCESGKSGRSLWCSKGLDFEKSAGSRG